MKHQARVLVADDEPGIREGLAMLLRRRGFEVTTAGDCAAAVQRNPSTGVVAVLKFTVRRQLDGGGAVPHGRSHVGVDLDHVSIYDFRCVSQLPLHLLPWHKHVLQYSYPIRSVLQEEIPSRLVCYMLPPCT